MKMNDGNEDEKQRLIEYIGKIILKSEKRLCNILDTVSFIAIVYCIKVLFIICKIYVDASKD